MFGVDENEGPQDFTRTLARRVREESDADMGLAIFGPNPPENIEPENSRRAPALGDTHMALDTGGTCSPSHRASGATSSSCSRARLSTPWNSCAARCWGWTSSRDALKT